MIYLVEVPATESEKQCGPLYHCPQPGLNIPVLEVVVGSSSEVP